MRAVLGAVSVAAIVFAALGGASVTAAPNAGATPDRVTDFQLTDTTRMAHRLSYYQYAPAIVLMSQKVGSPLSRAAAAELAKLQAAYKDRGVLFYMIDPADTRDQAAAEVAANKFAVPVLVDDLQLVGEQMNIQREGEVFVLDPKAGFKVAYHGPLDDRFNKAAPDLKVQAGAAYAAAAIDSV